MDKSIRNGKIEYMNGMRSPQLSQYGLESSDVWYGCFQMFIIFIYLIAMVENQL